MNQEVSNKYSLALSYSAMFRYKEAETLFKECISEEPHFLYFYVMLAKIYFDSGKYQDSYETALSARNQFGFNADINSYIYLWWHIQKNDFQKAEEVLLESLQYEPDNGMVFVHYINLLLDSGFYNKKVFRELLERVVKNHLNNPLVLHYLTRFLNTGIKLPIPPKQLISLYIESSMDDYRKYMTLISYELHYNNYEAVDEYARKAFEIHPNNTSIHYYLAFSKIMKKRFFKPFRFIDRVFNANIVICILTLIISLLLYLHLYTGAICVSLLTVLFTAYYFSVLIMSAGINKRTQKKPGSNKTTH